MAGSACFPVLGKHNELVKTIRSLTSAGERSRRGAFVAEGLRVVRELLDSSLTLEALLCSASASAEARALAREAEQRGTAVYEVDPALLDQLASTRSSQGLLGLVRLPAYSWEDLLSSQRLLVLAGIQDPGNVGTLLRTARAFGFEGALCLGGADPFNAKAVRSAAGAAFVLPVLRLEGTEDGSLERLAQAGFSLVAAEAHKGESLSEVRFPERLALVMGAEVSGISVSVEAKALLRVTIPLGGQCESLNVAAAGAVLMYEIGRRCQR